MNPNDVIESYVRDVAGCLPRGKRNDVAFELRALLGDELAAKAQAAGRAPDKAMVMALLKGFGRPAEVAGRYHQRPALIEPADTHHFLIWTLAGAVSISVLAAMSPAAGRDNSGLFLKWLGALVIVFALIGWWRRRYPQTARWKPSHGPDWMPRGLALLALVATLVFPVFMYAAPQTFVRIMFLGAIPSSGVELTEAFLHSGQRIAAMTLLILLAAMYVAIVVQGGQRSWMGWMSIALYGGLGLLLGAHGGLAGQGLVFASPKANEVAAPIFGLVGAFMLLCAFYVMYQEWVRISPAPALEDRRN
jgi:hypothetical protein